ncbi:hypothetical protein ACN6LA_004126 [Streptomyces sp. SAS_269]|uniref:hypothetical protein n=1 Tax=Streptomyces sp. SAS_269 TaxID=3412749 RepID=UPI00403CFCF5
MLSRFVDAVAGRLAAEWLAVGTQGLVFWSGGLAALTWGTGQSPLGWLQDRPPGTRIVSGVAALLAVVLSGAAVHRLTPAVLPLLEGYGWPARLHRAMTARQDARRRRLRTDWTRLHRALGEDGGPGSAGAPPGAYDAFVRTDAALRRVPAAPDRQLPTWIGNTMRSAELRPYDKYGLDAVKCWPHLWLLLPAETRTQLTTARATLDSAVSAFIWSAAFVLWTPWAWWAAPVALAAAAGVHRCALRAPCAAFADLLEAAFDLHRFALYDALRWPAPRDPAQERREGPRVTAYLWRGSGDPAPVFTAPTVPPEDRP